MDSHNKGLRMGSAVCALGLGLAFATTPGVAVADESETGARAHSAESGPSPSTGAPGAAFRPAASTQRTPAPRRSRSGSVPSQIAAAKERSAGSDGAPQSPPPRSPASSTKASHLSAPATRGADLVSESVSSASVEKVGGMSAVSAPITAGSQQPVAAVSPTAAAIAEPAGMVSGFLRLLGIGASGAGSGTPSTPVEFVTGVLALVRRELQRVFAPLSAQHQVSPGAAVSGGAQTASPKISIANASVTEGNSGTSSLVFTVTLSTASAKSVSVAYATSDGTATAGQDYKGAKGTITFAAGVTSQVIKVSVSGDIRVESNETFTVTLSKPSGATINTGTATGTIVNNDSPPPTLSIANATATATEGNSNTSNMGFTVSLSTASTKPITVNYATTNGTATAGQDFNAASGTITFAPGITSQVVNIGVIGDTSVEPDETFTVTLSNPSGSTITTAAATGAILNDDLLSQPGGTTTRWGTAFFSPYTDICDWPVPDLVAMSQATGATLINLGFMQVNPNGNPAWGGYNVLEPTSTDFQAMAINASIAKFRAAGGDVAISFGGAAGTSLAEHYAANDFTAQSLANTYGGLIDTYGVSRLDFDIESVWIFNTAAIDLNNQAISLLQQAHPEVQICYTLGAFPGLGLTSDGMYVMNSALKAGVNVSDVNLLAMDYGEWWAPTSGPDAQTMGTYAIRSAESAYDQMTTLFAKYGKTFSWNQIGITPMIGVNDITTEIFTVADAQQVEDFARAKGVGMLSFWALQRDNPGTLGAATHHASGVSDPAGSYSNVWNDYGTINLVNYL